MCLRAASESPGEWRISDLLLCPRAGPALEQGQWETGVLCHQVDCGSEAASAGACQCPSWEYSGMTFLSEGRGVRKSSPQTRAASVKSELTVRMWNRRKVHRKIPSLQSHRIPLALIFAPALIPLVLPPWVSFFPFLGNSTNKIGPFLPRGRKWHYDVNWVCTLPWVFIENCGCFLKFVLPFLW